MLYAQLAQANEADVDLAMARRHLSAWHVFRHPAAPR
jgi:hypothetical protein